KSPLFYQMAQCTAAGIPFLGWPTHRGRVLYMDFELTPPLVYATNRQLIRHLGLSEVPDGLILWNGNHTNGDWNERQIEEMVGDIEPDLIIVDTLGTAFPTAEDNNPKANDLFNRFRGIQRQVGATSLFIHHLRKPAAARNGGSELEITKPPAAT